jgi:hypothetical protein
VVPSVVKRSALQDSLCGFFVSLCSWAAGEAASSCTGGRVLAKTCTRPVTRPTATRGSAGWKQQSCRALLLLESSGAKAIWTEHARSTSYHGLLCQHYVAAAMHSASLLSRLLLTRYHARLHPLKVFTKRS